MLGLPSTTNYNIKIPKQKFYDNISVSPTLKRIFVEQIQSIVWANKIAPSTLNINSGTEVTEIQVFKIVLSSDKLDESVLKQIDKQIPYHILYVLEYNDKFQIWIAYKKATSGDNAFIVNNYYHTEWLPEEMLSIQLEGLNIDMIYENLVRQIGNIENHEETLVKQIEDIERKEKIRKEIEKLEKLARNENQPKKKMVLVKSIREKEKLLREV